MVLDKSAAFSICTYFGSDPTCADIKVKNNLAAGSVYSGFLLPGHDCADTSGRYSGNVAHSINGALSGTGVYFNEAPGQKCTQFSNFKAYKCYMQGAIGYPAGEKAVISDMIMVDNKLGVGCNIGDGEVDYDMKKVNIEYRDIKIYGEFGSPDCP